MSLLNLNNWKTKIPRDSKYLAFIRTLPCLICGTTYNVQSHHTDTGGVAIVGSDYSALPVCLSHHRDIHQSMSKRGPWSEEELLEITTRLKKVYENL